ncbi:DUF1592 domain-containing protein [Planctomicrobium sp.]|nr:DUF1592 domain-containing protein [Planctomicrobium sp.]MDB4743365.1 DUF1592 domain-containing protein [Planctomicrobium sp.]
MNFPFLSLIVFTIALLLPINLHGDVNEKTLRQDFVQHVQPFLKAYCLDCHGQEDPEAKLDLSLTKTLEDVTQSHQTWKEILHRVDVNEMPPADYEPQPTRDQRQAVISWIREMREFESKRNAGDPGVVMARRLSHAEYNYTIHDLTGVDIQPTRTFPVDPANEAGFDNTGESLTMSPALMNKYLAAAREVADYLVLTPTDLLFAPHPAVTETDRDKFCVNRIVDFYARQPTDLADYFFVCWKHQAGSSAKSEKTNLNSLAAEHEISESYTQLVFDALQADSPFGPLQVLQKLFKDIPLDADPVVARVKCVEMREYVNDVRPKLGRTFTNLEIPEVHKGSQSFVLWKNEQYAANRRAFNPNKLFEEDSENSKMAPAEFILPKEEKERQRYLNSVEQFCSVFPDAFYVSERGRDYLGTPKEKQEKGRLLSAGFHSMMGYFRDDVPLYELILDDKQRDELDRLWNELDFVTFAPQRQYLGFLWFERTDSRFIRDPEFDFARAEDKHAASEEMIQKLSKIYLAKASRNGGKGVAQQAIADYFEKIDRQIRWVEIARVNSQSTHQKHLLHFASNAWRRELTETERESLLEFYRNLRQQDGLDHIEAMRDSVVLVLMSPNFLYRTDSISVGEGRRQLTHFEFANRLSYFLWSSAPDDQLRKFQGDLDDRAVISAEVHRMLSDERINRLATEFATNWLDIRRFEEHNSVDRDRFPQFTNELRQAMFAEPIHFFIDLVRQDRSILELLNARHTFVNAELAKHYGMDDSVTFSDSEWQQVQRADKFGRGGLLGMSVFMTKNSPGLRTSPVKRGYWVVRRILGEMVPPPPPNVPDLPEDESQLGDLSLRELLARHRDDKSCAGCHDRFDSIGLAFEGFGPIGERRDRDLGNRPVETFADFPGGVQGTGLAGLREYLVKHRQEEFVDNFCRKFLAYALGRTLLLSDESLIDTMKIRLQENDYRFSSLVETIITSPQFLTKRGSQTMTREL